MQITITLPSDPGHWTSRGCSWEAQKDSVTTTWQMLPMEYHTKPVHAASRLQSPANVWGCRRADRIVNTATCRVFSIAARAELRLRLHVARGQCLDF